MDRIFQTFLANTAKDAAELQLRSDIATIDPLPPMPPSRYRCTFQVPFLRRLAAGLVEVHPGPVYCGISLPEDYLRSTDATLFMKVASVLNPGFLHPNVLAGAVCLGRAFTPGTPIGPLVSALFDIVTYRNCTVDERNALDPEACRLVREYPALVDQLPRATLFRATRAIRVTVKSS